MKKQLAFAKKTKKTKVQVTFITLGEAEAEAEAEADVNGCSLCGLPITEFY